jgi:hypothetical protein
VVFDASALLEFLGGGPIAEAVADRVAGGGSISALTQLELLRRLHGVSPAQFAGVMRSVGLEVEALDVRLVVDATRLTRAGVDLELAVASALARARGVRLVSLRAGELGGGAVALGCDLERLDATAARTT